MKDQFVAGGIVVENAIGFWIHRVYQASRNEMFRAFRAKGEECWEIGRVLREPVMRIKS